MRVISRCQTRLRNVSLQSFKQEGGGVRVISRCQSRLCNVSLQSFKQEGGDAGDISLSDTSM